MMTYYEMVVYLETLIKEPRSENIINKLNNINIDLKGDRYFRFIDHVSNLIHDRLENALYVLNTKLVAKHMNSDEFSIEFNEFISEVEFVLKITQIKIINDENREELIKSIFESNNNMLDKIKTYFGEGIEDEIILSKIDSFYRG